MKKTRMAIGVGISAIGLLATALGLGVYVYEPYEGLAMYGRNYVMAAGLGLGAVGWCVAYLKNDVFQSEVRGND